MSGPPGRQDNSVKVAAILATATVIVALLILAPEYVFWGFVLLIFALA